MMQHFNLTKLLIMSMICGSQRQSSLREISSSIVFSVDSERKNLQKEWLPKRLTPKQKRIPQLGSRAN
jgi:hypothetical protein